MNFKERIAKTISSIQENLRDMHGMAIPTPGGVSVMMVDDPKEKKIEKWPDTDPRSTIREEWHDDFSEG